MTDDKRKERKVGKMKGETMCEGMKGDVKMK